MQYRIEDDVPITAPRQGTLPACPYPYFTMKVGQSFLIPAETPTAKVHKQIQAATALRDARKRAPTKVNGFTITTRQVENGVRVWRTK